jgi:hypothetical protein
MATFKHNKKRNTGLVYEFLVRRLSSAMVEQDKQTYAKTLDIIRKYYSEGNILAEERELFEVIRTTRGVTESAARRILNEVQKQARKLDAKKLDIKKSNLLKEINYTFGQNFFAEHRVPDYRLIASIQMVIDGSRGDAMITESVAKIQLEEGLVQYMTTKGSYTVKQPATKNEVDALVMKMMAKRFEEKYSKSLIGPQKVLLEKFIRKQVTGDSAQLTDFMYKEMIRIDGVLSNALTMKEAVQDKVMRDKLVEAKQMLMATGNHQSDDLVEKVMMFQKLAEEITSDE